MAGRKRPGPLQAHMVLSALEESDAPQTVASAPKHVVDDEGTQTKGRARSYISSSTREVC
eukprot:867532-Prorocentrum_lima.AAC.1